MTHLRPCLAALCVGLLLTAGQLTPMMPTAIAGAAPVAARAGGQPTSDPGGPSLPTPPSIPNPLAGLASMLSPDHLGKLIQDTAIFLLQQLIGGLHDLLVGLTQGDDNVITNVGQPGLPVLLTTRGWIEGCRDGALGPIWRDAERNRRTSWPG